ncbi:glutamyl-tRNA reductase [Tolumonas osonensis]|uniref:Glutamyl-tRNA reductase n=1 Tax=Tolumonas osonensis TaxID=675874 RepID=A0A841G5Q3_9GAMM|nr:glutamyl-tRNA reductase [Tolumonas osonensis]MBB6054148.1 glutamyl-tRNA reductase [Tolumonas osonensis]
MHHLFVLGVNHKTASLSLRERVAFGPERIDDALAALTSVPGVKEGVILSTCNRTELYCAVDSGASEAVALWLSRFQHLTEDELQPALYQLQDGEAVRHLMRVAAGLDSLVLGEPQILGQVKQALDTASKQGSVKGLLNRLFQRTFSVAKRVRTETEIGAYGVSVAYVAVTLARQIFGDLSQVNVLLIGAGETIELVGQHLHGQSVAQMTVANRTLLRAQAIAGAWQADVITLNEIPQVLPDVDLVISSTASPLPILGKGMVERALKQRRNKPMLLIDIAVPRDIEEEVGELSDAYLYTVDDLQTIVAENQRHREQAARQAEQIVQDEREQFMNWFRSLSSQTQVRVYRQQADTIRQEQLALALRKIEQGEDAAAVLTELSERLTNKLIHTPTEALRQAGESDDKTALLLLSQALRLDEKN